MTAPRFILLGREGDAQQATRPTWALDGSFLVFRLLPQRVPEFDQYLLITICPIEYPNSWLAGSSSKMH